MKKDWTTCKAVVLAIATASLLIACGGGGGGGGASTGGGGGGTVAPPPVVTKALEVLSTVVDKDDKQVDASKPVDPRVTFRIAFSESLAASGIGADRVQLSDGTRTYPVNIAIAGNTLTVIPTGNLHTSLYYTLTIKAGATSADGSALKTDHVFSFRTVVAVFENKQLAPGDRSVGSGPDTRIQIADINGDGRPDLVKLGKLNITNGRGNGYSLSIFLQNATGGFDSFQKLEHVVNQSGYSAYFNGLVVQDIDGDNKPELLVPELPSEFEVDAVPGIRVFKAGVGGKFSAHDIIATPYTQSLQAMDVDGDGMIDLVGHRGETSFDRTSAFQILRKTSSGFEKLARVVLPGGDYEFGVSDLDSDGKRELIVNRLVYSDQPTRSELLIYSQTAPATFSMNAALTNEAVGFCSSVETCTKMRVVDTNGDGKAELVFTGFGRLNAGFVNAVITFSRPSGAGLTKVSQVTLDYGNFYGRVFGIQDMDGDAVPDLLALSAGNYAILEGASNFSWVFSNELPIPVSDDMVPTNVAIADIDGDGLPDIIFDSVNSGIVMARQVNFRRRP